MIRSAAFLCAATLAFAAAGPGIARPQASAQAPADAAATVSAARKLIADRYVVPETAARLDAALAAAEGQGAFHGLSGEALADRLTAEMREVTADGHLYAIYDPRGAAEFAAAPPPEEGGLPEGYARAVERGNGGVRKLEVLPGNIRYLEYDGFDWGTPAAEAAIETAMRFLQGGDAAIIDLRGNGGGSPEAVAALTSYFLPPGSKLARFEMRGRPGEATETSPVPFTLAGKPVYVLIGRNSFSAAEEFATHVSAFGFGTLVGANTGGGGFRNDLLPLPGGIVLSVSTGRPVHAVTGGDWERVGVAPAIAVPEAEALAAAMAAAMADVAERAPAAERAEAERLLAFYRAQAERAAPALPLAAYEGRYGERIVRLAEGTLTSAREGRAPVELVPVASDTFAPVSAPTQHFRFVSEGGNVVALEVDNGERGSQRAERRPLGEAG